MPPKPKPAKGTKGTRTGAAARSGPSGPSIPRAQRKQTKIEISLSPEAREALDARAERLGLHRSRVVESLILGAETEALLTPEGSHNLARVARDSGLSAREALRVLLAVDPYLWALLLTAAQRTGGDPGDLIAVGLRQAILAAAKGS